MALLCARASSEAEGHARLASVFDDDVVFIQLQLHAVLLRGLGGSGWAHVSV